MDYLHRLFITLKPMKHILIEKICKLTMQGELTYKEAFLLNLALAAAYSSALEYPEMFRSRYGAYGIESIKEAFVPSN